jgi:uncharacterized protein (DUF952 family)
MVTVFHIAHRSEWEAADLDGDGYAPPDFEVEGFIHCSTRAQVLPSAARHFAGEHDLVLVALDSQVLGDDLIPELAPSVGEAFPHLYRPITGADVLAVAPLTRDATGAYVFPPALS